MSSNLEDEHFKSLLVQLVPFASFLEEIRTNNARDFSNLDKAFSDRIKAEQRSANMLYEEITKEEAFQL